MAKNRKPKWYNAYVEIARFALPLVEQLLEKNNGGVPSELMDQFNGDGDIAHRHWEEILNDICISLRTVANDEGEYSDRTQYGLELFGKWFMHLWD